MIERLLLWLRVRKELRCLKAGMLADKQYEDWRDGLPIDALSEMVRIERNRLIAERARVERWNPVRAFPTIGDFPDRQIAERVPDGPVVGDPDVTTETVPGGAQEDEVEGDA